MNQMDDQQDRSDAELLEDAREGNELAYELLVSRHWNSAVAYARTIGGASDAEDLVSMAVTKILVMLRRGQGPTQGFGSYLRATIRTTQIDTIRKSSNQEAPIDSQTMEIVTEPSDDGTEDRAESELLRRAFMTLPQRWQQVLWARSVNEDSVASVAEALGVKENAVAALHFRAREGLRQAYLSEHLEATSDAACREVVNLLPRYVRGALRGRETEQVEKHLDTCLRCAAALTELGAINTRLGASLAPLALAGVLPFAVTGIAQASTASASAVSTAASSGGTAASSGAGSSAGGSSAGGSSAGGSSAGASQGTLLVAAGVGVAAVVAAVAFAVTRGDDAAEPTAASVTPSPSPTVTTPSPTPSSEPTSEATSEPTTAPTTTPTSTPTTSTTTTPTTAAPAPVDVSVGAGTWSTIQGSDSAWITTSFPIRTTAGVGLRATVTIKGAEQQNVRRNSPNGLWACTESTAGDIITLQCSYDADLAKTGGFGVDVLPTGTSTTVSITVSPVGHDDPKSGNNSARVVATTN